jgi:lipoprotein-anchoring transpeptidase ErfK/SrfK
MMDKHRGRRTRATARHGRRRGAAWLAAMAVLVIAVIAVAVRLMVSPVASATGPARTAAPASRPVSDSTAALSRPSASPPAAPGPPARAGTDPVLSPGTRRSCAPKATACADLKDHITWLQSDGRIIYGPVRMEPGAPADPTPRGIFHVAWKAGAHYISTSFGVPIPYAVFFAPGGIAFHAGSFTKSSHGCIHLTLHDARYYHDHLPIGAEVDVF